MRPTRFGMPRAWAPVLAAVVLFGVLGVLAVYPAVVVGGLAAGAGSANEGVSGETAVVPSSLLRSLGYALGIGFLASLVGLPAGWVFRARTGDLLSSSAIMHRSWFDLRRLQDVRLTVAMGLLPLLLPSYLAYAGWGILRGPGTYLGDWIAHRDPWVAIAAGKGFAVLGLVLWVWPVAALVQTPALRRVPDAVLDALRMEPRGWGRFAERVRLVLPALGASTLVVGVLMLGSAIPLHVAQVQTYAIQLWKVMQLAASPAMVWVSAWPLLGIAVLCAAGVVWSVRRGLRRDGRRESEDVVGAAPVSAWTRWLFWGVWALSVPGPGLVFLLSLRQWRSIGDFWRVDADALWESLAIGCVVGAIGVVIGVLTLLVLVSARGAGWGGRRLGVVGGVMVGVWVVLGLVPGVLLGSAYNSAFAGMWGAGSRGWTWIANVPTVLAHVARWGFVPVLVAVRIFATEPETIRQMRKMDETRAGSVVSWWMLFVVPNAGVLAGVFLAMVCVSMHEIESTVMVQPPGSQPLAQVLLDYLHFARDEQLSAACVNLLGIGGVLALVSGWLVGPLVAGVGATGSRRVR